MSEKNASIRDRQLINETVLLDDEGPDCIVQSSLKDCHIVFNRSDNYVLIWESTLENCTLEFKRALKNKKLFGSDYRSCIFKGRFLGVDFGRSPWPDPVTHDMDKRGEVIDCDFTGATLDLCRFFNGDLDSHKFASWPQFVVPHKNALDALRIKRHWPGKFDRFLKLALDEDIALSATTGTFSDFKKRYDVGEEDLRQALNAIGVLTQ